MPVPRWSETAGRREELLLALRALTCLPLGGTGTAETGMPASDAAARAGWAYPIVGLLIGLIGGLVFVAAAETGLPPLAAALLAIGATVLVSGARHEIGLADAATALGGNAACGTLALIFAIGLRAAALVFIAGRWDVLAALIAAHAVGRGILAIASARRPVTGDGTAQDSSTAVWAGGLALLIALFALGFWPGIPAVASAAIVAVLIRMMLRRSAGGGLGAIEQGGETVMLLAASAWNP